MESIQETFGTVGKIIKITIHDPHSVGVSATSKKPDFMLSSKEVRQHQKTNAKGGRKGQYRGQGNGQIQQNRRGQGHGSFPTISGIDSVNKPIPGPRMPDGTRGFTIVRGRSLLLQKPEKVEVQSFNMKT